MTGHILDHGLGHRRCPDPKARGEAALDEADTEAAAVGLLPDHGPGLAVEYVPLQEVLGGDPWTEGLSFVTFHQMVFESLQIWH